jgi:hypothetical protein
MISLFTSLIPSLFKIGDKLIADEDKKMEFAFKVQEMAFKQMEQLINAKTYPWVDALVKLAYASEQIIKGLFRPIASACMLAFAMYCEVSTIELSDGVQAILYGAFPAWGASRHIDKQKKKKVIDEDEDW